MLPACRMHAWQTGRSINKLWTVCHSAVSAAIASQENEPVAPIKPSLTSWPIRVFSVCVCMRVHMCLSGLYARAWHQMGTVSPVDETIAGWVFDRIVHTSPSVWIVTLLVVCPGVFYLFGKRLHKKLLNNKLM